MLKLNNKMVLVVLISLIAVTGIYSQNKKEIPVKGVENLVVGIKSDNYGLRRTSIFLAGEYKIKTTAPILITAFRNEEKSENKILIALSLYRIGDGESLNKLYDIAKNDNDPKVRTICSCVMQQYSQDNMLGLK